MTTNEVPKCPKGEPALAPPRARGRPSKQNDRAVALNEYVKEHPLVGKSVTRWWEENEEIHEQFPTPATLKAILFKRREEFKFNHPQPPFTDTEFDEEIKNLSRYYREHHFYDIGTYQQFRNEYLRRKGLQPPGQSLASEK